MGLEKMIPAWIIEDILKMEKKKKKKDKRPRLEIPIYEEIDKNDKSYT